LGITVNASAAILQSQLSRGLPPVVAEMLPGLKTDAQRAIQFVRSTPGITTGLVGMSRKVHVDENLQVAGVAPDPAAIAKLFEDH
jgi:aryl-alcohol dehydrogenase-like predicted oxidoreductase